MARIKFKLSRLNILLIIAIIISVPLTVWSFNNLSSDSYGIASSSCKSIGGSCVLHGRDCSTGYTGTDYYCSTGICCLPMVSETPSELSSSFNCQSGEKSDNANIRMTWKNVSNANKYYVYWKTVQKDNPQKIVEYKTEETDVNAVNLSVYIPKNSDFYWNVRGYNEYSKKYGPFSSFLKTQLNCK